MESEEVRVLDCVEKQDPRLRRSWVCTGRAKEASPKWSEPDGGEVWG